MPNKAADRGIKSSAEHAGAEWCESASCFVRWFFRVYRTPQTIEACRAWSYAHGLPQPPEHRAWGSVTQRALRDKVIVKTGDFAPATSSNRSPKSLYLRG